MSPSVLVVALAACLAASALGACTQAIVSCTKSDSIASDVSVYTEPAFETLSSGDTYTSYTTFTLSEPVRYRCHCACVWDRMRVRARSAPAGGVRAVVPHPLVWVSRWPQRPAPAGPPLPPCPFSHGELE